MGKYAARTSVSPAQSRMEIESLVERYGAAQFYSGYDAARAMIGFTIADRQVRFELLIPEKGEARFTTYRDRHGYERQRSPDSAAQHWEQEVRSRWRALALVIKAKLEAVEVGISTFEQEFLANIVTPGGALVGEIMVPRIAAAYATGSMVPLLSDHSGDAS